MANTLPPSTQPSTTHQPSTAQQSPEEAAAGRRQHETSVEDAIAQGNFDALLRAIKGNKGDASGEAGAHQRVNPATGDKLTPAAGAAGHGVGDVTPSPQSNGGGDAGSQGEGAGDEPRRGQLISSPTLTVLP